MRRRLSHICAAVLFAAVWILPEPSVILRRLGLTQVKADTKDKRVVDGGRVDLDRDAISDGLATSIAQGTFRRPGQRAYPPPARAAVTAQELAGQWASLIVALDHPPSRADVAAVEAAGGRVNRSWSDLIFAMSVDFPLTTGSVADLEGLKQIGGVVLVEENAIMENDLYMATKQIRARQVWTRYALTGNPLQSVAVFDSGIGDTHIDLRNTDGSSRVIGWLDPNMGSTSPNDTTGHGTFVSGIIAGNGRASGGAEDLAPAVHPVPVFASTACGMSAYFGAQLALSFPVDTTAGAGALTGLLKWENSAPGVTNSLRLRSDTGATLVNRSGAADAAQPLQAPVSVVEGRTSFNTERTAAYRANATTSSADNQTPYWVEVTTPMTSPADRFNIMNGVAPTVSLVGVKVNDDTGNPGFGRGNSEGMLTGLTYVDANRDRLNIVAINMSLSFRSGIVASVDAAINNLIGNGIVVVAAAGNGRIESPAIPVRSPASASRVIAVAAQSETDQITLYSAFGNLETGLVKPDVSAPGGSVVTGRAIMSLDTDTVDENVNFGGGFNPDGTPRVYRENTPDQFPNDYVVTQCFGTSFAAPMVAGQVALITDALSRAGLYRRDLATAMWIKSIILMTASETNRSAESLPDPTLDRGGKDTVEGNGRINVEASVEVIQEEYQIGTEATERLGTAVTDRKVFARHLTLEAGRQYNFSLTVPAGADYDLYLYRYGPDLANFSTNSVYSEGDPVIAVRSTSPGNGLAEQFTYSTPTNNTFALIVKRVAGVGNFTLRSSSAASTDTVAPLVTLLTPNGGDIVFSSSSEITWQASDNVAIARQDIFLSLDDGAGFLQTVALNLAGDTRNFVWTPPADFGSTSARFMVVARDAAGNAGQDASDRGFAFVNVAGQREVEPNDNIAQANLLSAPARVVGTTGRANDMDYFAFDAAAGAQVTITTNAKSLTPASVMNTTLTLYDATGQALANNTDFGGSTDSRIQVNLPGTGRYFFRVRNNNAASGSAYYYQAVVEISGGTDTLSPSIAISNPLAGQAATGTITVGATASDNVGVMAVQFSLDGAALRLESVAEPFRIVLDTLELADGEHVVEATARDQAGNVGRSAAVSFRVANAGAAGRLLGVSKAGDASDFRMLQAAFDSAQTGDIITINDSADYAENLIIGGAKRRLTLRAAPGQHPTISGRPDAANNLDILDVSGSDGITIDGIRFSRGTDDGITASPGPGATNLVIKNCVFEGLVDTGVILNNGSTAIVRNNQFSDLGSPDVTGAGASIQNSSQVDLIGNRFTNLMGPSVIYINGSSGAAMNNLLVGGPKAGDFSDGFVIQASSANVYNNIVRNAGRFGIGVFNAGASEPVRTSQVNLVQNLVYGSGIAIPDFGDGIQLASSPNTINLFTLVNNTVVKSSRLGINFALQDSSSRVRMYNTIIYESGSTAGDIFDGGLNNGQIAQILIGNCLIGKDTVFNSIGRNGTFSSDPMFTDLAAADLHLRPASPAIDAGDNSAPFLPAKDLQDLTRIVEGNGAAPASVDLGVYEFAPTGSVGLARSSRHRST